jgi:hypothetical protein
MKWLVFSYSLPSNLSAASRVRIWRKLRKSGAVSPKLGVHVLPYNDDCVETVRCLAAEVERESGETIVMQVDRFENLSHDKVIDIFRNERMADYKQIEGFIVELEKLLEVHRMEDAKDPNKVVSIKRDVRKLKKNIDEVSRMDFFKIYDKHRLLERLHHLQKTLLTGNLILLFFFSMGALNPTTLREMKDELQMEEQIDFFQNNEVKLKRPQMN